MSERERPLFELAGRRVWVAGHRGMVGSALMRRLAGTGCELLTVDRAQLDLRRQADVEAWMTAKRPHAVFLAAARVGGIEANRTRPADFSHDNLLIAANVVATSARLGVAKLMFLGAACLYPPLCPQPMAETMLMTGPLEPSNEAYAMAKLAGINLCKSYRQQIGCDFISVLPASLYGPGDNLDPAASHVVPAMIRKVLQARASGGAVEIWGSGRPLREFLYVDDAADAMVFLMQHYSSAELINIGGGETISVGDLARLVADILGFVGPFHHDASRPDGMKRRQLDASRILAMGWRPSIGLRDGLAATCRWIAESLPPVSGLREAGAAGSRGAVNRI